MAAFPTLIDKPLDLETSHAAEIWAKYINRHTGRRSDAATGTYISFIYEVRGSLTQIRF